MSKPLRFEIEAAGHVGHVFTSVRPASGVQPNPQAGPSAGLDGGPLRPAVVLVHGIGVSHRYLRRLHEVLAGTVDTYSVDLPGFGSTPRPERTLTAADHGAYVLEALEQLGVRSMVFVGHSMGVQLGIEAALQQPERVSRLVLMGPVVDPKRRSVLQQALALGCDSLFHESPSANALVLSDYLRCGPIWYIKTLRVMMDYATEDRITGVRAPVLVLRGINDPVAGPEWARMLASRARNGQLVEVSGSGHVVQHNRAVEVAAAIRSFAGLSADNGAPQEFRA